MKNPAILITVEATIYGRKNVNQNLEIIDKDNIIYYFNLNLEQSLNRIKKYVEVFNESHTLAHINISFVSYQGSDKITTENLDFFNIVSQEDLSKQVVQYKALIEEQKKEKSNAK